MRSNSMDPEIWGPHYWFFLHSVAFNYPRNPTAVDRKIHYRLIHHFSEFIPDTDSSNRFRKLLDLYPVSPYLDTKEDLVGWMHALHNRMNTILDKPTLSLEDHKTKFLNPTPFKDNVQAARNKWFLVIMIVLIVLILLICSN